MATESHVGCDCCAGVASETPTRIDNAPGLRAIRYRVGRHATFKTSILARLSGRPAAALAGLGARTDDDFTIAIADGFATMADVLTFYQERNANEAFLRTATERRSVLELARLIGYQLDPGVAADAWLAFLLDEPLVPTVPRTQPVTIPVGTRVQSVPGPDEAPQTFETVAAIEGRMERNAIRVQTAEPQPMVRGLREIYLEGTSLQVAPGDIVLIVGDERLGYGLSERWDVRLVRSMDVDLDRNLTRLGWLEGLGSNQPIVDPAQDDVHAYVFRQRAAIFGHNAPDPRLLATNAGVASLANVGAGTWNNFDLSGKTIDLDQAYQKIAPGGWLALVSDQIKHAPSSLPGYVELYHVDAVAFPSVAEFALSSKVTRVTLDTSNHVDWYGRRDTLVLAQTEELPLATRPIRAPVYGDRIALATIVPDLALAQALAVSGKRQHLRVGDVKGLALTLADGLHLPLGIGDRVALLAAPTRPDGAGGRVPVPPSELEAAMDPAGPGGGSVLRWELEDRDGRRGSIDAAAAAFVLDPASKDDPVVSEVVLVAAVPDSVSQDRDRTYLRLGTALARAYDRQTVRINANVAPATHGESVSELVGGGDASKQNQRFGLKQGPLTFVSADTPSGSRSTLRVIVGETVWPERPSLFGAAPGERSHVLRVADDGVAVVGFGDGTEGARLPTGQANVRVRYRKGLGAAGNVREGQLTTLLTRPLGVASASNPEPATGGEDPERIDDARRNAPLTVLTLGRAVSRRDYEDFARAFAGIAKAHAAWVPSGPRRGIVISVAGPDGASIEAGKITHQRLSGSLAKSADPRLPIAIRSYRHASFVLRVDVKVTDDAADPTAVLDEVRETLRVAFAFDAREFGQGVSIDEAVAVAHRVGGVVAVDVNELRRSDQPASPAVRPRLVAAGPSVSGPVVEAAELLTLDADALVVGQLT
jgi:hypothetical protein